MLYKTTGGQGYLDDAKLAADYIRNTMSDASGILSPEGDWNEQGVLKSILAQYLAGLARVVPRNGYSKWVNDNMNLA